MSDRSSDVQCERAAGLIERDRRRIFGSIALAAGGQAGAFAAGLGVMIVTVRLLGPAGYGQMALFFMFLEALSQLIAWPNLGLVRFGRQEMGETGALRKTFGARAALFAVSAAVAAGLLFIFRAPVSGYLAISGNVYILLLAYVLLNEAIFVARGVYQTTGNFAAFAGAAVSVRAGNLAVIVVAFLALGFAPGPAAVLRAHIVSLGIVVALFVGLMPWKALLPLRVGPAAMRQVSSYSWPLVIGGFTSLVVNWVDLMVLKAYRSPAEVGLYAVAFQVWTVIMAIQAASVSATLPLLVSLAAEKRHDTLQWLLDEALPQAAWLLGPAFVALAAGAELLPLVMKQSYAAAVAPCEVIIASMAFTTLAAYQAALAQAMDRVRVTVILAAMLAVLKTALDLALVPTHGINGAAISHAIAVAFIGLAYFGLMNNLAPIRGDHPARRYRALAGLAPVAVFAVAAILLTSPLLRAATAAALAALTLGIGKACGIYRKETLRKLELVRMPAWTRAGLIRFYSTFGR